MTSADKTSSNSILRSNFYDHVLYPALHIGVYSNQLVDKTKVNICAHIYIHISILYRMTTGMYNRISSVLQPHSITSLSIQPNKLLSLSFSVYRATTPSVSPLASSNRTFFFCCPSWRRLLVGGEFISSGEALI